MRGRAVIAGIGHTRFGALAGQSTTAMVVDAVRMALHDAGLEKNCIDAVLVKPPTSAPRLMSGQLIAEALGLQPTIGMAWDQGGAAVIGMLSYAVMAIDAGLCEVALLCFADNPRTGNKGVFTAGTGGDLTFGYGGPMGGYAMIARRHMQQYGTSPSQLGAAVVAARRHGAANPNAQLRKPLSIDEYLAVPPLVAPFRRDDCALVSDGGAAILVTSAGSARALGVRAPVPILGFGQGQSSWDPRLWPDLTSTLAARSGAAAFAMAGVTHADIDIAQLYDCFSIVPLMTLEDYGFCAKGRGGAFVEGGRIEIDGDLPVNTAGGLLSETGMPGMQLVIEAVRQIRGEAALQARKADTCVVSCQGGIMQTHGTLVLGR